MAAFIAEGHLDRHIRRIRGVYGECRSQLSQLLKDVLPSDLASLQPSDQGMHSVLWLARGIDDQALSVQAARAGVAVRPVSRMYAEGSGRAGLILGLGAFSAEQIAVAARRLAFIITAAAPAKRGRPRNSVQE